MNEGSKSEQPTRPVNLRDDEVDIDNKAACAVFIAAEHEVI
jgi:hypothetical protein